MEARMGETRAARLDAQHDSATAERRDARLLGRTPAIGLALLDLQLCPLRCLLQPLHQHTPWRQGGQVLATWMPDLSSSSNSICSRFLPVQRMMPSGEASSGSRSCLSSQRR